jgi:hypothetical protein
MPSDAPRDAATDNRALPQCQSCNMARSNNCGTGSCRCGAGRNAPGMRSRSAPHLPPLAWPSLMTRRGANWSWPGYTDAVGTPSTQTWELGTSWNQLPTTTFPARYGVSSAYDASLGRVVAMVGRTTEMWLPWPTNSTAPVGRQCRLHQPRAVGRAWFLTPTEAD